MKRILLPLLLLSSIAWSQTKIDYNTQIKNLPEFSLQYFGAICDGNHDDTAAWQEVALQQYNLRIVIKPLDVCTLNSASVTLPKGITIAIKDGGEIVIGNTYTLTVQAPTAITANLLHVFYGQGSVALPAQVYVSPLWWGADPTGVAYSDTAFSSAISGAISIKVTQGTYSFLNPISLTKSGASISCEDPHNTVLQFTGATDGIDVTGAAAHHTAIYNCGIATTNAGAGIGININATTGNNVLLSYDVVYNVGGGSWVTGASLNNISNGTVEQGVFNGSTQGLIVNNDTSLAIINNKISSTAGYGLTLTGTNLISYAYNAFILSTIANLCSGCSTINTVVAPGNVINGTPVWSNFNSQDAFSPPGSPSTYTNQSVYNTMKGVNLVNFGAYCDGAFNNSNGAYTAHDDGAVIQLAINTLSSLGMSELDLPGPGAPSGPNRTATTTGNCGSSIALSAGNGTSTTVSTQNGFTIRGWSGRQWWTNLVGGTNYVVTSPGTGNYIPPSPGASVITYTGTYLNTSPFFSVNGPLFNIHLEGLALDCRNNCQTGIYFSAIANSIVRDVYVINNYSATNIWNAGFWISAYSSTFPGTSGYSGSQNNTFDGFGAASMAATPTGIMIGCFNANSATCIGGTGTFAGVDVSLNKFLSPAAIYYGSSLATGLVLGFEDSNTFVQSDIVSQTSMYLLYQNAPNALGFPAANSFLHYHMEAPGEFLGTKTLGGALSYGGTSLTLSTTYTTAPICPCVIQVDQEVMIGTGVSGGGPTYTITVTRNAGGTQSSHLNGAAVSLNGFFIDGSTPPVTSPVNTNYENVAYFNPVIIPGGNPVNFDLNGMLSSNVTGVTGVNQNGIHFNSALSSAANRVVYQTSAFSSAILASGAYLTPAYFNIPPPVLPDCQVGLFECGNQSGVVITLHGKIGYSNISGGAVYIYPLFQTTDSSGSTVFMDGRGFSIANGNTVGEINFTIPITIFYTSGGGAASAITATYSVGGNWIFDDLTNAGIVHAAGGQGGSTGHLPDGGLTIKPGIEFNTNTGSASATLTAFWITVDPADKFGVNP